MEQLDNGTIWRGGAACAVAGTGGGVMEYKTCKRCGGTYSEVFFRRTGLRIYGCVNTICIGCELTERTECKRQNRPREKARRTLHHHADKYIKLDLATSRDEFVQLFGWNLDQMAHDIQHAYGNGCPYCHQMFQAMGNGLSDLTLDILNPELPPYYETNVRWACATCNQEKQRTSPSLWGQKLQDWKQWRKYQCLLKRDQGIGTLFEGIGVDFSAKKEPLV